MNNTILTTSGGEKPETKKISKKNMHSSGFASDGRSHPEPEIISDIILKKGNLHEALNYEHIKTVAQDLFRDGGLIKAGKHQDMITGSYDGMDLKKHGAVHYLSDLRLFTQVFRDAIQEVYSQVPIGQRKKKIMSVGEAGRLIIPTIEIAHKKGIKDIVISELNKNHVEQTKKVISEVYDKQFTSTQDSIDINGLHVEFILGDFLKIAEQIRQEIDAVFAMWFVTPEIADLRSVQHLKETRNKLYSLMNQILIQNGTFVDDIPNTAGTTHFYGLIRAKTCAALEELGILQGENHTLIITDNRNYYTKISQPDLIRSAPKNGDYNAILQNAGFEIISQFQTRLPSGIKNEFVAQHDKLFGDYKYVRELFEGHELDELIDKMKTLESQYLIFPGSDDVLAKIKKTTISQKKRAVA